MSKIQSLREFCQPSHKKYTDPLMEWHLIRPISIYITYVLDKLGVSADGASALGFFSSLIGASLMLFNTDPLYYFVGSLFFVMSFILDCVDGELARLQKTSSIRGIFLDYIVGGMNDGMILGALTVVFLRYFNVYSDVIIFSTIFALYGEKLVGLYSHSVVFRNIQGFWDDVKVGEESNRGEEQVWRKLSFRGRLIRVLFETFFRTVVISICMLGLLITGRVEMVLFAWLFAMAQAVVITVLSFRSEYFRKRVESNMYGFIKTLKGK